MISLEQINGEIAALEAERPTYVSMDKLALLYTVRDHMVLDSEKKAVTVSATIPHFSDTEFGKLIEGMEQEKIWPIMDELMVTVKAIQPSLYKGVIDKIEG